ncbi:hypothetical protein [Actinoallomurus iriomotensis]|uniref:Phosphoglyceromutase n=1 Tax=Actinoallomurus iriomotensis TaxID=478107 RepID=A0A9W6RNP9_9ACTN|nr:hypothetical protein [Actinoallomurus iriomotensis]GLY77342.1 hypothetical protein Airi01_056090 [Actinoallomurus iriomotensis]
MPKRVAAALALAAAALIAHFPSAGATPAHAPSAHAASARHVVLIGVPGLRWNDVGPSVTPNLWRLAGTAGTGLLSVRAVGTLTCPADGWVTVSAGARSAAGPYCHRPVHLSRHGEGAMVGETERIRRINAGFGPVGLLADAVHRAGGCVNAVGAGAALAAADGRGRVDTYAPAPAALPPGAWSRCAVSIVDAGMVGGGDRASAARRADTTVGTVLAHLPAGTGVVVAGVADDLSRTPHLRLAIATGPGTAGRYLGSDSTRRANMVILPDLTATLLASAGVPAPAGLIGTPLLPDAVRPALADSVADLSSQDVAAQTHRRLLPRFFAGFVISQVLLYAAAALALRHGSLRRRRRILSATRLTALIAAAVPVSTYLVNLVPWWHMSRPALWLVAGIAAGDALVVGLAMCGPWRRHLLGPGTVIAGVTAAVLAADLLTGTHLQLNSMMGYSPLVGGRYYGMGNIAFAVLATSTLLASAGIAQWLEPRAGRRAAVAVVLALTLTAALLDSWTAWGSDFGGLVAFVPGLATTALLVAGRRVSFLRLQLLRATGMALVLGVAWIDYLRPPSRQTHMGRFFGQLVEGDSLPWLERKFAAMVHTFGNPTLLPVVVAGFLFVLLVLHRPGRAGAGGLQRAYERAPMLRAGLSGAFVTAVVGGAVNDSGIAVPALALAVAVPLALAAAVVALQETVPAGGSPTADAPAGGSTEVTATDASPGADQRPGFTLRPAEG